MEGKLKKIGNEYKLYAQDDSCIATTHESPYKKISLKNCEAIENGYDLDELASKTYREFPTDELQHYNRDTQCFKKRKAFIKGFKKALEIFGDKKFSEGDVLNLIKRSREKTPYNFDGKSTEYKFSEDELIQSLQQTEWDVEIEMEPYHDGDFIDDGKTHIIQAKLRPRLDSDGCLILKRK